MRVLIVSMNTAPELVGVGKYTGELASSLADQGHAVRVVAAPPYYPDWQVRAGWSRWRWQRETSGKVVTYRCPLYVPRRPSGLRRMLHLASFAASSAAVTLWLGGFWRPDAVIVVEPNLLTAPCALAAARLAKGCAWLHVQDFEIDAAFALGMVKGAWLRHQAARMESWLMRRFDRVSTISQRMCERLRQKGVDDGRILLLPNWVDAEAIFPMAEANPLRAELGIAEDKTVALYAGNMAAKQGLETLIDAARALRQRDDIVFVLAGAGPSRTVLEERASDLANVRFLPLQPLEKLNQLLNLADVHLLPQRSGAADLVMPSKLSGMFASGRAVVAGANPGTELEAVVAPRGILVPPEDASAFAGAVQGLADDAGLRARLGAAGRAFVEAMWSRQAVVADFDALLGMGRSPAPDDARQRPYFVGAATRVAGAVSGQVTPAAMTAAELGLVYRAVGVARDLPEGLNNAS